MIDLSKQNRKYKLLSRIKQNPAIKVLKKISMLFKEINADDIRYFVNDNITIIKWADVVYEEFEDFAYKNNIDIEQYPFEMTNFDVIDLNKEQQNELAEQIGKELVDKLLKSKIDAVMIDID